MALRWYKYGYTDYITEDKLLQFAKAPANGRIQVRDRSYRAMVVFCSPLISAESLKLMKAFAEQGGKVIWCSAPALRAEEGILDSWKELFGVRALDFPYGGLTAKGKLVQFTGMKTVQDMEILTDFLPDYIYPVVADGAKVIAKVEERVVGLQKEYTGGGAAVYLGFRPRDDQSCSLGADVETLFSILKEFGCYEEKGCEISSRPAESRYIYNRFPNGTVTLANHMRTIREGWYGTFYRDEKRDCGNLKRCGIDTAGD